MLAKTALAYNVDAHNQVSEAGVRYVGVFDGYVCGRTAHSDQDKGARTLCTGDDAADWPISHPCCRRAFGPQPYAG